MTSSLLILGLSNSARIANRIGTIQIMIVFFPFVVLYSANEHVILIKK
jgi:hypothetical protein